MDRAQGATQGVLPQNLRGTHTSAAESSGRRYVAAALLGDGHAAWHLATNAEAADRGLVMLSSEWYCPPASPGEHNFIRAFSRRVDPSVEEEGDGHATSATGRAHTSSSTPPVLSGEV